MLFCQTLERVVEGEAEADATPVGAATLHVLSTGASGTDPCIRIMISGHAGAGTASCSRQQARRFMARLHELGVIDAGRYAPARVTSDEWP